MYIYS